ncbi:unnamed protein product [Amaranthus hypochondriacus]
MGEPAKARGPGRPRKAELRKPTPAQTTNTPVQGLSAAIPATPETPNSPVKNLTQADAISGELRAENAIKSPCWAQIVHGKTPIDGAAGNRDSNI